MIEWIRAEEAIELRHWVALDGRADAVSGTVDVDEVCNTKDSSDLDPFASEHEGYMGNYGNTVDRWYHRAAVVLWPRDRTFVIRSKASPRWAIDELTKTLRQRHVENARGMAQRVHGEFPAARQQRLANELATRIRAAARIYDT